MSTSHSPLSKAVFQGEEYYIVWMYDSGCCEIKALKKRPQQRTQLVHVSELELINDERDS